MNEIEEARKAREHVNRATLAQQVIGNSAYQQAITMMKADCFTSFEKSEQGDSEHQNKIWLQMNAINELEANLEYIMENGVFAQEELTRLQRIKKNIGI